MMNKCINIHPDLRSCLFNAFARFVSASFNVSPTSTTGRVPKYVLHFQRIAQAPKRSCLRMINREIIQELASCLTMWFACMILNMPNRDFSTTGPFVVVPGILWDGSLPGMNGIPP